MGPDGTRFPLQRRNDKSFRHIVKKGLLYFAVLNHAFKLCATIELFCFSSLFIHSLFGRREPFIGHKENSRWVSYIVSHKVFGGISILISTQRYQLVTCYNFIYPHELAMTHPTVQLNVLNIQYSSKISEPINAFPTQSQRVGVFNLTR